MLSSLSVARYCGITVTKPVSTSVTCSLGQEEEKCIENAGKQVHRGLGHSPNMRTPRMLQFLLHCSQNHSCLEFCMLRDICKSRQLQLQSLITGFAARKRPVMCDPTCKTADTSNAACIMADTAVRPGIWQRSRMIRILLNDTSCHFRSWTSKSSFESMALYA